MKARIAFLSKKADRGIIDSFVERQAFNVSAEAVAISVLGDIKTNGNSAVVKYAKKFDGVKLDPARIMVAESEIRDASLAVDPAFRRAVRETRKRIVRFAKAGIKKNWRIPTPRGGYMGEQFVPMDRIGVYIPGGAAPLASTALMTATLAEVAGVPQIVACTPADDNGNVNPFTLYALEAAGATEIYRVGGIQAIGLMAYGTETVQPVQKIVGPGGAYVTAAKRQVYGQVALDLVAGPSEIAVLADGAADPALVAADLLSQAEHGSGWEKALLVTTSKTIAERVQAQLEKQAGELSRRAAVRKVISRGMLLVVVKSLEEGIDLCNDFAAEHLEIMTKQPGRLLKKVRKAGAVFLGRWTPESVGDFVAGPSHVLPTGGAAEMFSGLTVDDFLRRSSYMAFTRADLAETLPIIETFGRVEGLDAHARSATMRFGRK